MLTRTGEPNEAASSAFTAFLMEGDSPGLTKGKKVSVSESHVGIKSQVLSVVHLEMSGMEFYLSCM